MHRPDVLKSSMSLLIQAFSPRLLGHSMDGKWPSMAKLNWSRHRQLLTSPVKRTDNKLRVLLEGVTMPA
jgi:hypothetical protein